MSGLASLKNNLIEQISATKNEKMFAMYKRDLESVNIVSDTQLAYSAKND